MKSRLRTSGLWFSLLPLAFLCFSGCTSEEVQQNLATSQSGEVVEDALSIEATLCRKVSRKSGRRIGVGQEFKVTKKSYVRAFVDFKNAKTERSYTVHLAWIRPDGREMFRKFAEVRLEKDMNGQFMTVINWLKAEDLHAVKSDTLLSSTPDFSLETRLNISQKKTREPGNYLFRVYLDRRLLLEEPFLVIGPKAVAAADSSL